MAAITVTVVSDDDAWRGRLESSLAERGFEPIRLEEAPRPLLAAKPAALLIDAAVLPYGATEMAAQLKLFLEDRCPPLVAIGSPVESDDGEVFDALVPERDEHDALVAELVALLPRLRGASGFVLRRDVLADAGEG